MFWKIVSGIFPLDVDLIKETDQKCNNGRLLNHENGDARKCYVGRQFLGFEMARNIIQVNSSLGFVMPIIGNWVDSAKIHHGFTTNKTKTWLL